MYVRVSVFVSVRAYTPTWIRAYTHTCIRKRVHEHVRAHIHAYGHMYLITCQLAVRVSGVSGSHSFVRTHRAYHAHDVC